VTEIQSTNQAVHLLNDSTQDLRVREAALHKLASEPTQVNLERLVSALEDPSVSIRWVAAADLAHLGAVALPALLHRLASAHDSHWVREGAYHICCYSSNSKVREQTQALQQALRGPAAEVVTTDEAIKLLYTLP